MMNSGIWFGYVLLPFCFQIQSAYERVSAENAENKQLLLAAQRKDEHTSAMLAELTSVRKLSLPPILPVPNKLYGFCGR